MISSLSNYFQHISHLYPIRIVLFIVSLIILYISYRLYNGSSSLLDKSLYQYLYIKVIIDKEDIEELTLYITKGFSLKN